MDRGPYKRQRRDEESGATNGNWAGDGGGDWNQNQSGNQTNGWG